MKFQWQLLTDRLTFPKFIVGSLLLATIITSLSFAAQSAQNQTEKKNSVKSPPQKASRKRVDKPKPLTRKDHRDAEQRLSEMGYWTGRVDGSWDTASRHALIAFQKVEGLKRNGQLTRETFDRIMTVERPLPRKPGPAHIEVDLTRQVLFIVDDEGIVTKILPVSTGSGKVFVSQGWARDAITPPGEYWVKQKIPGWKKSPLGLLYYPVYFMYGTAIHGYSSVPTKPASHGCVRIPMFAAKAFYKMTPMGMPVIVYRETSPNTAIPADSDKQF